SIVARSAVPPDLPSIVARARGAWLFQAITRRCRSPSGPVTASVAETAPCTRSQVALPRTATSAANRAPSKRNRVTRCGSPPGPPPAAARPGGAAGAARPPPLRRGGRRARRPGRDAPVAHAAAVARRGLRGRGVGRPQRERVDRAHLGQPRGTARIPHVEGRD